MKQVINSFEKRIFNLSEEDILNLSDKDISVFNVVNRLNQQVFGTFVWDDEKPNFDYYLSYIYRDKSDKIGGFMLPLQPFLEKRNELTNLFSSYICHRFPKNNPKVVFNTYQHQQRSIFEKKDYWTYDDELRKELQGRSGEIYLKHHKEVLYVPFTSENNSSKTPEKKLSKEPEKNIDNQKPHFVYIMHNRHNNYFKIGRSIKPKFREKTLQAEEPDIKLIEKWEASAEIEKILHRKYKKKRIRGEWFQLDEKDIFEIKELMNGVTKRKPAPNRVDGSARN